MAPRGVRLALFAVAVATLLGLAAPPASAHNRLLSATPGNGADLAHAPRSIELLFDGYVQTSGATVTLHSPSGAVVALGGPRVDGTVLVADVPTLTETGSYAVGFRVVGIDGHPLVETYAFSLRSTIPDSAGSSSSMRGLGGVIGAIVVVLGGLVGILWLQLRRTRRVVRS